MHEYFCGCNVSVNERKEAIDGPLLAQTLALLRGPLRWKCLQCMPRVFHGNAEPCIHWFEGDAFMKSACPKRRLSERIDKA
jgi:hypothetical protein